MCAPKEIIEIQINREFPEKVDTPGKTGKSIEFISTGAETIENRQLSPRCLIINTGLYRADLISECAIPSWVVGAV